MKPNNRTARVMLLILPLCPLVITFGCCSAFPPCSVDVNLVAVDESSSPAVPDQYVGGCFIAAIERTFATEAERLLILRAEALASTIGPSWYSETRLSNFSYAYPDAVTDEAITFYAKRIRSFQMGEGDVPCSAMLTYSARIHIRPGSEPINSGQGTIVRLELRHFEIRGPLAASQIFVWREVEFNDDGEIVNVLGDGGAIELVS